MNTCDRIDEVQNSYALRKNPERGKKNACCTIPIYKILKNLNSSIVTESRSVAAWG